MCGVVWYVLCLISFFAYPNGLSFQTLDEVDFTVLAATSVLGDLMHKCPPAEACRDAFERMSKATVEMSLSTTGFGSQVDLARIQAANAAAKQSNLVHSRARQYARQQADQRAPNGLTRRQIQMRQARPVPRFDMNLEDLFGNNAALAEGQGSGGMGNPVQPYPISETSDPNFTRPNPQRNPSMEYYGKFEAVSPQAQQAQQQYYYGNSPQQSGSPNSVGANTGHPQFQAADPENPSGVGLDYLDYDPASLERQMSMGSDENSDYKYQGMPSLHGAGHNVGIDLGFGMAVDFQHDWSENANYDLLEGYFFGGGQGPSGL